MKKGFGMGLSWSRVEKVFMADAIGSKQKSLIMRKELIISGLFLNLFLFLILPATVFGNSSSAIHLSKGPHLFIDDYLIEKSEGLSRVTHQPEKLSEPIITKVTPYHEQPLFYMHVDRKPESNLFRMWYNLKNPNRPEESSLPRLCYAYAESEDGINWVKPNLEIIDIDGSTKNNIIKAPFGHYGLAFIDEGADFSDPNRRYKMGYYWQTNDDEKQKHGLWVAFSADGFNFTEYEQNPVIHGGTTEDNVISDVVDACWDPLRKQYIIGCKMWQGSYPGKTNHAPKGFRRIVGMTVSKDFINWSEPWIILLPDLNNGVEEFYGVKPMVRGDLYIGFLRVLRDDLPADPCGPVKGIGWTELITSRDGETWERYQEPFLDRNKQPDTWDHAMSWVGACVTVGDQEYIYYGGYSKGHKPGDRELGVAKLRKNGFVSRDTVSGKGKLQTPLVVLDVKDPELKINAKVKGKIRLRILDKEGKPIRGFNWSDCLPIKGDSVVHEVKFKKRKLSELSGQELYMEFSLCKAQLYGFDL